MAGYPVIDNSASFLRSTWKTKETRAPWRYLKRAFSER